MKKLHKTSTVVDSRHQELSSIGFAVRIVYDSKFGNKLYGQICTFY